MHLLDCQEQLSEATSKLDQLIGSREQLKEDLSNLRSKIKSTILEIESYEEIRFLFQALGAASRTALTSRLEPTVTQAIQETMENDNLEFRIVFDEEKNSKVDFKLFDKQVGNEYDIVNSFGGSLTHIINVVLRVMFAEILNVPGPLIFDEPGTFIDQDKRTNFSKFLRGISEELGRQLIVVSHDPHIIKAADALLTVFKDGAISRVEKEIND